MINLLMFDLDGTLFDTAPGIANAFNTLLVERGEAPLSKELISSHIGFGIRDLIEKLEQTMAVRLGDTDKLEEDFRRHYLQNFISESYLYPGVIEFLESWPHHLAIVSNKNDHYVNELVLQTELRRFRWRKIIGGNTLEVKKPDPLPIQTVLRELDLQPHQALMIGDGLPDIQAAQNAGVKSIAVTFGYTPLAELIQSGAHASINHYKQLANVIQQFSVN